MTQSKLAYLCSADTMPRSDTRRSDAWEHDLTIGMLGMGLHELQRAIVPVCWDDQTVDWRQFECAVIGTTWDYASRCEEFLERLQRIAKHVRVLNSPEVVAWNARKTYLRDMQEQGCNTIPTVWLDLAIEDQVRAAFAHFDCDDLVVKPQVGAGAWRQVRLNKSSAWPATEDLPPGPAMVQPFLPNISSEGEFSFLYFNRKFSHAVRKIAASGDYRIQSTYGGRDLPHLPSPADLQAAELALSCATGDLLYARVDMVRGADGALKLMELELIEPYLYPVYAPQMGSIFRHAYRDLLGI
jgi:hypothetical protein